MTLLFPFSSFSQNEEEDDESDEEDTEVVGEPDFNPYDDHPKDDNDLNDILKTDWSNYEKVKDKINSEEAEKATDEALKWAKENEIDTKALEQSLDKLKELQKDGKSGNHPDVQKEYKKVNEQINAMVDQIADADDLKSIGLEVLIKAATIVAKKYEEVIYNMLKKVLPKGKGVVTTDPVRNGAVKKSNTKPNHKTLIRQIVEVALNEFVKKEVNGSYSLDRNNINQLKKVGFVNFLEMTAINWELYKAVELKSFDKIASGSEELFSWYKYSTSSIKNNGKLYDALIAIPSNKPIPTNADIKSLNNKANLNQIRLAETVDTRKKALATTYNQLADRYTSKGLDLQSKLSSSFYFKMTEGERIKAQKIVNDYLQDAIQLRAKADLLVKESMESKTAKQKESAMKTYQIFQSLIEQK